MFTTATFSDIYLQKLLARFDIERENIDVLYVKPDIPKLYLSFQKYKWPMSEVSLETLPSNLGWVMDILASDKCPQTIIFTPNKNIMNMFHKWIFEEFEEEGPCINIYIVTE